MVFMNEFKTKINHNLKTKLMASSFLKIFIKKKVLNITKTVSILNTISEIP